MNQVMTVKSIQHYYRYILILLKHCYTKLEDKFSDVEFMLKYLYSNTA